MCGFAAILGHPAKAAHGLAMARALAHRGPDGEGLHVDEAAGLVMAHRRLSIIDLSDDGRQPMGDAGGRRWIVFNGEIYNYLELAEELHGYPFRSRSDTEVILAAYDRWGEDCVERFVGMFAFALWDGPRNRLFCARDRLGVKPFFHASHGGQLFMASEIKALLAAGVPARPDLVSWAGYLTHGQYETGEATFFDGIRQLPPGHVMVVEPGGEPRIRRYWNLPERVAAAGPLEIGLDEAADRVEALVHASVALRLRSDVPVAVSLSGGLDSSVVAAAVASLGNSDRFAFTACHNDPRYDEDLHAREILGSEWRHVVEPMAAADVPALADEAMWHQEAPYGGVGTLGIHKLHKRIRQCGIKVVLEGQGGDEAFAGYASHVPAFLRDLAVTGGGWRAVRREVAASPRGRTTLGQARLLARGGGAPLYQDGTSFLAPDCVSGEIRRLAPPPPDPRPFASHLANAQFHDLTVNKLPRVLRMNDRLAMASGVELRQPLLDHRLMELAFRLPVGSRIRAGVGKQVLRQAFSRHLPQAMVWGQKRPVVTPQREWLSGPLADWVGDQLASTEFRALGWFEGTQATALFDRLRKGALDNSFPVWQWVSAISWWRCFQAPDAALPSIKRP